MIYNSYEQYITLDCKVWITIWQNKKTDFGKQSGECTIKLLIKHLVGGRHSSRRRTETATNLSSAITYWAQRPLPATAL